MESERKAGEERLLTCTSPPLSLSLSLARPTQNFSAAFSLSGSIPFRLLL